MNGSTRILKPDDLIGAAENDTVLFASDSRRSFCRADHALQERPLLRHFETLRIVEPTAPSFERTVRENALKIFVESRSWIII